MIRVLVMSVPENAAGQSRSSTPQEIPDKLYFRIGEVARLAGIKPYVLRFWETEFPSLGPKKSGTGHRLYRRKEVEMVLEIKRLLYEKRFTIEGARKFLETRGKAEPARSGEGEQSRRRQVARPNCSRPRRRSSRLLAYRMFAKNCARIAEMFEVTRIDCTRSRQVRLSRLYSRQHPRLVR